MDKKSLEDYHDKDTIQLEALSESITEILSDYFDRPMNFILIYVENPIGKGPKEGLETGVMQSVPIQAMETILANILKYVKDEDKRVVINMRKKK